MRAMRTRALGVVIVLAAFPLGCSEDDQSGASDNAGQGSGASAGMGGKGGAGSGGMTDSVPAGGGEGGASADADQAAAAARLPLCESVCTTEGETACPPPDHDACVKGWCEDANHFFPLCIEQSDAFVRCMANEPTTSYFCDPDGMAFPKEDACADEQAAMVDCYMATMG
jgi:hypothetical protein